MCDTIKREVWLAVSEDSAAEGVPNPLFLSWHLTCGRLDEAAVWVWDCRKGCRDWEDHKRGKCLWLAVRSQRDCGRGACGDVARNLVKLIWADDGIQDHQCVGSAGHGFERRGRTHFPLSFQHAFNVILSCPSLHILLFSNHHVQFTSLSPSPSLFCKLLTSAAISAPSTAARTLISPPLHSPIHSTLSGLSPKPSLSPPYCLNFFPPSTGSQLPVVSISSVQSIPVPFQLA